MAGSSHRRYLVTLVASLLGCSPDLAVPEEAVLTCRSAEDCPAGYSCSQDLGRCVSNSSDDASAPSVIAESVVIQPEDANASTKVFIRFSVNEDLGAEPVILLRDLQGIVPTIHDAELTP